MLAVSPTASQRLVAVRSSGPTIRAGQTDRTLCAPMASVLTRVMGVAGSGGRAELGALGCSEGRPGGAGHAQGWSWRSRVESGAPLGKCANLLRPLGPTRVRWQAGRCW
jgi:hypothetical protein